MAQRGLVAELWGFMRIRKKFWLLPVMIVLVGLGAEDLQRVAHRPDFVPAAQPGDPDIKVTAAHGAHGGGHVL